MTREQRWCNYPILIIVLQLGHNDAQPLITRQNTSRTDFPSTVVLSPKYGAYGRPGGYASSYRVPPPERGIDSVSRLRPGNYVSQCWVYHPSQALIAARELRSLMYGVPSPHLILEEDSRYSRNALSTQTATYWLPKRLGISSCTSPNFGNPEVLTGTYSMQNLQGELRHPKG